MGDWKYEESPEYKCSQHIFAAEKSRGSLDKRAGHVVQAYNLCKRHNLVEFPHGETILGVRIADLAAWLMREARQKGRQDLVNVLRPLSTRPRPRL
jgi:hypothetical protein